MARCADRARGGLRERSGAGAARPAAGAIASTRLLRDGGAAWRMVEPLRTEVLALDFADRPVKRAVADLLLPCSAAASSAEIAPIGTAPTVRLRASRRRVDHQSA